MKTSYLIPLALAISGSTCLGASLKISTSSVSNGSDGGSYTIKIIDGPASNVSYNALSRLSVDTFEGFCLEPKEYFSPGSTYAYTIASFADGGGNEYHGLPNTPGDQLSKGPTWLYSQFAKGMLATFDYAVGAGRKADNKDLQRAFWYLEDDYTGYNAVTALNNPFLSLVAAKFGSLAGAQDDAAVGAYGVWALNLTSTDRSGKVTKHQSQLYYHHVPEVTSTLALIGMAMAGLVAFRRK